MTKRNQNETRLPLSVEPDARQNGASGERRANAGPADRKARRKHRQNTRAAKRAWLNS